MDYLEPIQPGQSRWWVLPLCVILALMMAWFGWESSMADKGSKPEHDFVAVGCATGGVPAPVPPNWHLPFRPPSC